MLLKKMFSISRQKLFFNKIRVVNNIRQYSLRNNEGDIIIKSKCQPLAIKPRPLTKFIFENNVENFPTKVALTNAISGQSWTYSAAYESTRAFGSALYKEGMRKGDTFAIMMSNCPEYMIAVLGAIGIGGIVTSVNPSYTSYELSRQITSSKPKWILAHPSVLATVEDAISVSKTSTKIIIYDQDSNMGPIKSEHYSFSKMLTDSGSQYPNQIPNFDFDNDVALVLYSSGTTGLPKGVMLTHSNIVSNVSQMCHSNELTYYLPTTDFYQPVSLALIPLFHAGGLCVISLTCLHSGGKLVTLPSFDPKTFTSAIEEHKPTSLQLVPPLALFCAQSPMIKPEFLEGLYDVKIGAAPVGEALINMLMKKAPNVKIREVWGMTELTGASTMTPAENIKNGSCGILVANTEAKIVDIKTGQSLGHGQVGEIYIRGPQLMKGYMNNPDATKATITSDGWLRTGDLAMFDEEHNFYIVDRLKELIKVKGFQVPPAELEDLIRTIPGVQDTAVIGVPDEKSGEVPRAYIVRSQNVSLTESDVHDFVNERVAKFKRLLGGIEFVDSIPKLASGKILRKDIRANFEKRNED